ncbi:hypothetical protein ZYGR_0H00300 [Zygosaccharomyces rouxii]|uniref:ZYRO0B04730p n=2 Tax=Zygosaccharomyces rouxii TaxID=4956 RepID=C5DR12_ZYGRC|nr:uncharacterized protein ZYRO0B04730g [Zygosaccharomyces rouxii]KAH9200231.1 hypothetical protein LQ764DRAFT_220567 [Zygosaccharomyces rouxii]GAV47190.1 hypothetical protein ZYGR_0H00300 [Zygosaccharomyces rouxii]CAR26223.1 ZYRO0B04730p [Zygosaccharomyces rouxii]
MKLKGHSHTGKGDMEISERPDSSGDVPAQVLFMDSSQGMSSKTSTHAPSSSTYYQVTTPKSPHELIFADEVNGNGNNDVNYDVTGTASGGGISEGDEDRSSGGTSGLAKSSRESEEVERLKYETAKAEILEKLHLHTLIGNKEVQGIQREICRLDAQMKLMKTLHDDENLLDKIESYHQKETERKKRQVMTEMNYPAITGFNNNSSGYYADSSSVLPPGSPSGFLPLSASSSAHIPVHHYHTRSKSHGNLSEVPPLHPNASAASNTTIPPGTEESSSFRANQMNMHHRRNYSSTCLTSNSGVVGKTEKNEAIFRRYDGVLIVITCSHCDRSGFTSAQGIVNHARLKHNKTYSSQPLAVLNNQILLPNDKQDPEVMEKFKSLNRDPQKEYLPSELAIPSMAKRETSPKSGLPNSKSSSSIIPQHNVWPHQQDENNAQISDSTKHLKKAYGKEDFKDLVSMVNSTSQDLENVLKESTPPLGSEVSEMEGGHEHEPKSPSSSSQAFSPLSPSRETIKKNNKKRKQDQNEALKDYKERIKPAEKKARPDVLALSAVPEHEKRSSHYNLRAKSKIRSNADRFD